MKPGVIRAVTHLDVNDEQIEQTIAICREVLGKENGDLVIGALVIEKTKINQSITNQSITNQ